jgi:hypothetical protein
MFVSRVRDFALRTRLICRAGWLLLELGFDFWWHCGAFGSYCVERLWIQA